MERKVGEIFEYYGRRLQIIEQDEIDEQDICKGCYFDDDGICRLVDINKTGDCCGRDDKKEVIFKEV